MVSENDVLEAEYCSWCVCMGKLELRWQIAGLNCNHGESEPANGQRGFRRCLLFSPVCLTFAVIEEVI